MDFGKLARKTMHSPCAIRRVEESNPRLSPISRDDILNIKITLERNKDVGEFVRMDRPRIEIKDEPKGDYPWF